MSSKTVNQYASHRASTGLPPTMPPQPMTPDLRSKAATLRKIAGHLLAQANDLDAVADATEARHV